MNMRKLTPRLLSGKHGAGDIYIEIDRPLFTYTFTNKLTNRSNGIVLATGTVTAFDGNDAAPKLAARIIEEIKSRVEKGNRRSKHKTID